MKTKFQATMSDGSVVTRTSEHPYLFAVGLRNKETGKVGFVMFTASTTPTFNWSAQFGSVPRGGSAAFRAKIRKEVEEERAKWDIEIVETKVVK